VEGGSAVFVRAHPAEEPGEAALPEGSAALRVALVVVLEAAGASVAGRVVARRAEGVEQQRHPHHRQHQRHPVEDQHPCSQRLMPYFILGTRSKGGGFEHAQLRASKNHSYCANAAPPLQLAHEAKQIAIMLIFALKNINH